MSGLDLARLKEAVAHIKAVPWTDAASAAVVALVNAADELIAAAEERDRLAGLLHGLHDAASEIVDGWSEGGCLVSPPCRACRWCIFERTVESVRAALKGKP